MFGLRVHPDFTKRPPSLEDRVAHIYDQPLRIPLAVAVKERPLAPKPIFGKRGAPIRRK